MKKHISQLSILTVALTAWALTLAGCWSPPNANVQPVGKPGLIQGDIPVSIIQSPVKVVALDPDRRTITLKNVALATKTFSVCSNVSNLDQVKVGNVVKATVKAELSVYILDHGMLSDADGTSRPKSINFNAKVIAVDPSYRLLSLKFNNGHIMTIKAGLNVQLEKMAPGDDVVMRSNQITAIELQQP